MKRKAKYGYMCKTDWDWELGEAPGGVEIYIDIDDLRKHRSCVDSCGIVKVKVQLEEIVQSEKRFSADDK